MAAFNRISQYDGAISSYLSSVQFEEEKLSEEYVPARAEFPGQFNEQYVKVQDLRYGENSHQQAAFGTAIWHLLLVRSPLACSCKARN